MVEEVWWRMVVFCGCFEGIVVKFEKSMYGVEKTR
jgi:hypothetical protein